MNREGCYLVKFSYDNYYNYTYNHFDHLCKDEIERENTIDLYISKCYSTVDFEVLKYMAFNYTVAIHYILNKYKPLDFTHLIASAIVGCDDTILLQIILYYYKYWNDGKPFYPDPEKDDILWLTLDTRNLSAFLLLCDQADLIDKYASVLNSNENMENTIKRFKQWDKNDINNCRNLIYSLREGNIELSLKLIEDGIKIDTWNNYPIRLCVYDSELKKHNKLVKSLFERGAKIPKFVINSKKLEDSYLEIKKTNMQSNIGKILLGLLIPSNEVENEVENEVFSKEKEEKNIFEMKNDDIANLNDILKHKNKVKLSFKK
jgi:hypothetical protein